MMWNLRQKISLIFLVISICVLVACDQEIIPVPVTESVNETTKSPSPRNTTRTPSSFLTPSSTKQPESKINVPPQKLRGSIITFWHNWSGAAGDVIQSLVDEFNQTNEWGIILVPIEFFTLDEITGEIQKSIQDGKPPNLVTATIHQALEWDGQINLPDLNTYVLDPVWGLSAEAQDDFYPIFWEQDVTDGKRLGFPAQRSGQLLFYNTTWAKELGYKNAPSSPEQFKIQACAATEANRRDADTDNDGTGGWIISTDYAAMLGWIYAFGGEVTQPANSTHEQRVYNFNSQQTEQAFTFLRGLFDEGCAWLSNNQYPHGEFAKRMGLFASESVTDIPYQTQVMKQNRNRDQWTVIAFPSPSLKPAFDVYGPSYIMLPASDETQLASWLFLKWMAEPERQAQLLETSNSLPLREANLKSLETHLKNNPELAAAMENLPHARTEPNLISWRKVRWALGDASTQLFRAYFTIDQVPSLLEFLNQTALELQLGPELSGVYDTPTPIPSPSATPTFTKTAIPVSSATISPSATPSASGLPSLSETLKPSFTLTPTR